jgi:hypothetical protein
VFSFDPGVIPVSITILDVDDSETVDFAMRNDTLLELGQREGPLCQDSRARP